MFFAIIYLTQALLEFFSSRPCKQDKPRTCVRINCCLHRLELIKYYNRFSHRNIIIGCISSE